MGLLIRRIESDNWASSIVSLEAPLQADVLGCLSTNQGTLSVWFAEDKSNMEPALLAIAAGLANTNHIHLIAFDEDQLNSLGFNIAETEGETAAVSLKGLHRDITNLSAHRALELAEIIRAQLHRGEQTSLTSKEIAQRIATGIRENLVDFNELKENVLPQVVKALQLNPNPEKCGTCKESTKRQLHQARLAVLAEAFSD
jgi:hypothetical protein